MLATTSTLSGGMREGTGLVAQHSVHAFLDEQFLPTLDAGACLYPPDV
jgi:hypothetical protein